MAIWNIPDELADMLRKRRVIPFIGAGFSSVLGLPDWNTLLSRVAEEIQAPLKFEKVKEDCQGDPLQIAEYYFLISDRSIGPLRFAIGKALGTTKSPILSGAHVELVNLGMPQIYTTNFDDLIEQTFLNLSSPMCPSSPIISAVGVYHLEYEVFSQGFPTLEVNVLLTLTGNPGTTSANLI
jgi:hypothetical protein